MATSTRGWQQRAVATFEDISSSTQRVFTRDQISRLLEDNRGEINPPRTIRLLRFINVLMTEGKLREVSIQPEAPGGRSQESPSSYSPFKRYIWGGASPYEMALSLRTGSYLSHASAVFLHGLTTQITRTVYANKEQSPKPVPAGGLTQEGIDRAFSRPPRQSQFVYMFEGTRLVLLSGKYSGNLEVSEMTDSSGSSISVTKLERTLIDITVRPAYAGGVFQVLDAFKGARGKASVATLLATLKRLQHVYPYHQAIGFYMQRAGYPASQLERIRALGIQFDFYLAHNMPRPQFDPEWRIYFPENLPASQE